MRLDFKPYGSMQNANGKMQNKTGTFGDYFSFFPPTLFFFKEKG